MATETQSPIVLDLNPDIGSEAWKKKVELQHRHHFWPRKWFNTKPKSLASPKIEQVSECLACATEFPRKKLVTLTCPDSHTYCKPCFEQLIQCACQNENSYPPQCCKVGVPKRLVHQHTSQRTRKAFDALGAATSIAPENRWYCPQAKCGKAFDIALAKVTTRGLKCPHCFHRVCILCRQAAHRRSSECNSDALKETMRESARRGWRTCYRCNEMIELRDGCRHITCRCGAQFCYICGTKWGKCVDSARCVGRLEVVRREEALAAGIAPEGDDFEAEFEDEDGNEDEELARAVAWVRGTVDYLAEDAAYNLAVTRSLLAFEADQRRREELEERERREVRRVVLVMNRPREY